MGLRSCPDRRAVAGQDEIGIETEQAAGFDFRRWMAGLGQRYLKVLQRTALLFCGV
jgi:hypothetical protein